MNFRSFLRRLQEEEGVPHPMSLAAQWSPADIRRISREWKNATKVSKLVGARAERSPLAWRRRSNQSRGTLIANFVVDMLNQRLASLKIEALPNGNGYPDFRLLSLTTGFACAIEFKATSQWRDGDSNRRVLLSSTSKLRANIVSKLLNSPPCHLVATINYDKGTSAIESTRLDFFEPNSDVSVRLEASTSHSMLANGHHSSILIA